ncbi:MAG: DUF2058 family protein [Proteobacteria bacterium]|nr:DUF2058 family protein [Pseudomonadota bacterium]
MSESLRDQLLKAGFAKKPVEKPKPGVAGKPRAHVHAKPAPSQRKEAEIDLARAYAQRANVERNERDQAQREAERIAREKKERKQKLAALLADKSLNAEAADLPRHFPHGNKIRRIYCTQDQIGKLNCGELAVVQLAGRYLLVTREIAMQAQGIQAEALVLLCDPNAPAEDDVPADLMW